MVSTKQRIGVGVLVVGVLSLLVLTSVFLTQESAVFFLEPTYSFDFGNSICRQFELNPSDKTQSIDPAGQSFVCGDNAYIPGSCFYDVSVSGAFSQIRIAKDCDRDGSSCVSLPSGPISGRQETYTIKSGRKLFLNVDIYFDGVATITNRATVYRLEKQSGDGFLTLDKDCSVGGLSQQLKNDPQMSVLKGERGGWKTVTYWDGREMLKPTEVVNYVANMKEVVSANNVIIDGINNGNPVYIVSPGQWCPILKEEDGRNLVDLEGCQIDDRIKCYPADINFCNPDATGKTKIEIGDECPLGTTREYRPVGDENCRLECRDGKLTGFDECIPREDCPTNKPFFNIITGVCEQGYTPPPDEPGEKECRLEGGQWVNKESRACGVLCNLGLAQPEVVNESFCQKPNYPLYIIVGLVIGLVVVVGGNMTRGGKKR